MGLCSSCEAVGVATAKVVMQDGRLREYTPPVRVSHVLGKEGSACFVCNSDHMEFGGLLRALATEEELQPRQLYFLLPLSMLKRPLQADDMAALAARASDALLRAGFSSSSSPGFWCCTRSEVPLWLPPESGSERVEEMERKRPRPGGRRGRDFSSKLGAIPE